MNDEERVNPGHSGTRALLRVIGPLMVVVGLLFTIVGFGSFFASFGSFGMPRYFWCAFIGLPLLGLGLTITKFAYMGSIVRYFSAETAPVAKDTFNYLAEGTKPGVRSTAAAIAEGLRGASVRCSACQQQNDADARFCRSCGAALSVTCEACGHTNEAGAQFCDTCGKPLGSVRGT